MSLKAKNILITGANRGLGLEWVKQLLETKPKNLVVTARDPDCADDLKKLASNHPEIKIKKLDVGNEQSIEELGKWAKENLKEGLNLLINNAGLLVNQNFETFTKSDMLKSFEINSISPLLVTRALLPLLKKASSSSSSSSFSSEKACVVNISTKMASIDDNTSGGVYPYRMSKTAENMGTKSLSIDLKKEGILVISLHPGWVKTDMGGDKAPLDKETSVREMIKMVAGLGEKDIGGFFNYDGKIIPW